MQAVILAAGLGQRLNSVWRGPKCLLEFGETTLLDYQINCLNALAISRPLVVVGKDSQRIRDRFEDRCQVIHNPDYQTTNSLYSFHLVEPWVCEDILLLNSDVLGHFDLFSRLVQAEEEDALLYDRDSGKKEEEMKIRLESGCLIRMTKQLDPAESNGENLGIVKLSLASAQRLFVLAKDLIEKGQSMAWVSEALNALAAEEKLRCLEIRGLPWTEIDFPEDLEYARREIWPLVKMSYAKESSFPSSSSI